MLKTKDSGLIVKAEDVADDGTIEGYGSVFGNVDSWGEVVEPGAFTASLNDSRKKGRSVKMLWQHNSDEPIGVWTDLTEDAKGLRVKGQLLIDVSSRAAEAYGLLKAGALDGLSIGYREIEVKPHADKPGIISLKKLALKEVSIVTFAANEKARVDAVKQMLTRDTMPTIREFEETLRELGFSRSKSEAMAKACAPHLRGEPEAQADELQRFFRALTT